MRKNTSLHRHNAKRSRKTAVKAIRSIRENLPADGWSSFLIASIQRAKGFRVTGA